jgi:hypothetical protein
MPTFCTEIFLTVSLFILRSSVVILQVNRRSDRTNSTGTRDF